MLQIDDVTLNNRFILGTALFPSLEVMLESISQSSVELITVALRRQLPAGTNNRFWEQIRALNCRVLPNTAGCRSVKEAVTTAKMAREIFETHWIKLEVIGDDYNLQPDPFGLLQATEILIAEGFTVFPYCTDDLVLCQRLVECGCRILMPWGAPIGSGLGLLNPYALETLRQRLPDITLIVDAGIRTPSQAARAMELGYDAVLLNSAVALADRPIGMAQAFNQAINAGRMAFESGAMPQRDFAAPSTPLCDTPFWQQEGIEK